jgi:LmbE family N-acetylglucosaminyl deacetylase
MERTISDSLIQRKRSSLMNNVHQATKRLIAFFAHPDDEAFSCAGVMALNKQRGIHNTLVCATKGEAGEISSPELATPENLGLVREQELVEAARHMGVDDLYFLGYRDSGMAGTPENQNPAAYANAEASAVVPRLVRFIRSIRPQVVITFDPTGGYGHPDHIAIHKHTVAAFHAAADASYAPHLGEPWQAQRLLYPTFRQEMFIKLRDQLIAQGIEAPDWGTNNEDNQNGESATAEPPIHAEVDVSAVTHIKWEALKSHRTQIGPNHPFRQVPEEFILQMLGTEWFEQAWPESKPEELYTDLFEGLAE